jgi:acyl-coenzyme A synthetase/AMP-(fatty) acid ligase
MYQHPAIEEACIVGTSDAYRGETVKAVIVLKAALPARPPGRVHVRHAVRLWQHFDRGYSWI